MTSIAQSPLVIEAAISPVVANTGGDISTTGGLIDEAGRCIDAGAGIVHYHHDFALNNEQSIRQCIDVQRGILDRHPSTLVYPGYLAGPTHEATMEHLQPIHDAGVMAMFAFDPGLKIQARPDENGLPVESVTSGTTFAQANTMVELSRQYDVPCSLGMFEPGPLRWVKAYGAAGRFTPGTIVKFYFTGDVAWGRKGVGATFGLPPSRAALDIYLSLIEGSGLPWIVSILGGAILETDLPSYVIERGGHLRVGVEDPLRTVTMTNVEMIEAVVEMARGAGRPIAHAAEARAVLSRH